MSPNHSAVGLNVHLQKCWEPSRCNASKRKEEEGGCKMELSTKILPARAPSPNPNNSPVDQIYLLVIHKCIIFGFYLGGVSVFQVRFFFHT